MTDLEKKEPPLGLYMVKWVIASIPALIILAALGFAVMMAFGALITLY